jgi:murein hydrolase activator
MRGFGLLTIIDHGKGYMSLYGYNQSLYKNVGDHVRQGEVIATVGDSGGRDSPGLYFEIRHDGKPDNPLLWCRADVR